MLKEQYRTCLATQIAHSQASHTPLNIVARIHDLELKQAEMQQNSTLRKNPSVTNTLDDRKTTIRTSEQEPSQPQMAVNIVQNPEPPQRVTPAITSAGRARHRSRRPSKTQPMIPYGTIIQGKYELKQVLGAGGYGQIFKAFDSNKNLYVAIKIMQKRSESQRMILEQHILFTLKGKPEFPQLYGSGSFEDYMYIVMELLGKSLSELRKKNDGKKFDAVTALRVGLLMTDSLRILHEMGFLHRDVKPGNMCTGISPTTIRRIYLLDFGLARQFKTKGRVKRRGHVGFRGTLRYVSLNVHERRDQCPCDDLISNFYTMVELCEGCLPWTRLRDPVDIARRKRNTSFEELFPFSGMSTELQEYYTYCYDNVEDPDQPNYDFLKDTVKKCLPPGLDLANAAMPWEGKVSDSFMGLVSQEGEFAEAHEGK
ncbi:hypothetical protein Q1695_014425 [Nippostrongylus brasiliensis]|nr:hypothetical protein Q1695_014425 [Nippostrongylus brasiliensis]